MNSTRAAKRLSLGVTPRKSVEAAIAGVGGFLMILLLAEMTKTLGQLFLIAPFGASCVLVFAAPASPLAQPRNVIVGHLISTAIGVAVFAMLGSTPFSLGVGVGLAIAAMSATGALHPPAGADPIVVILAGAGWSFLFLPVLVGTVLIVLMSALYRTLVATKLRSALDRPPAPIEPDRESIPGKI
jgi:CBS-domain-containing membrane protein